jgi:hypothetical protein
LITVSRRFTNVANSVLWRMAIILKANKVNLFVSSVLFVFWYHSPYFLDTPRINPSQHFPFGAAFVCQAGNFWTLLRTYLVGSSRHLLTRWRKMIQFQKRAVFLSQYWAMYKCWLGQSNPTCYGPQSEVF